MASETDPFHFEYLPTEVLFGEGCVKTLGEKLDDYGFSRVLVVCGTNVGANHDVIDPMKAALGDRLVSIFAQTTPTKDIHTVLDGAHRITKERIDCAVAVGGGSSINVARAMCLLDSLDQPNNELVTQAWRTGSLSSPNSSNELLPNFVVPTTMAGADLTHDGGITVTNPEASGEAVERRSASFSDERLLPAAVCYDPQLFATTPTPVLAASAMNGFDKGLETVYSRESNPISRAHALQGLRHLRAGLPGLRESDPADEALHRSVLGILLVQYGRKTNIIHAFGNGISNVSPAHQGVAHGVLAPRVLRYVFDRAEAERRQIATALGLSIEAKPDDQIADAIISVVSEIRDALDLPAQLRTITGISRADLPEIAERIARNRKHSRNPPGIAPSTDDVHHILTSAW